MKKNVTWLFIVLFIAFLAACGQPQADEELDADEVAEAPGEEEEATEEDEQSVEVDRGLLNVEITIPPMMLEDQDIDQVIADAKEAGVKEVTENEDGSLTYKMSRSTHNEMMSEMREGIEANIEEIKQSDDYPSIADVRSNQSYSEFTLVVDQEAFENSFDGFAALGLAMTGMYYQIFNGDDPDKIDVTIHLENAETGEVFNTTVYPDAFEE
ncbi:hypothetical protein [Halalkalibacter krulwichiae]|uniref:Antigen I/II N-terminal domain-containing protein n=1 Tax=Halalkalibacter krulwichiae TaxID=199441 RepID=A0A1X9MI42_9BACI|nr:hypothetical protein [Halalkalibacter krulwichiae]ARK32300.1 hypothetical protein BkAM31D_21920 [Halalkalibacter krulwichiae]